MLISRQVVNLENEAVREALGVRRGGAGGRECGGGKTRTATSEVGEGRWSESTCVSQRSWWWWVLL